MLGILLCVAYAVLWGLCGLLFIAVIEWLFGFLGKKITPEMKQLLQAIVVVFVVIMLLLCIFGHGDVLDVFHLHAPPVR